MFETPFIKVWNASFRLARESPTFETLLIIVVALGFPTNSQNAQQPQNTTWESARRRYRIVDFRDWLISRSTIKHVQLYRMVPSNLRSYNRQNLYAPSIDDILAFATYINVHDIDIFLRRNRNEHYKHIRKSALALYSSDIELVVRKEDSTSNRRLSSLNFNLSRVLYLSLGLYPIRD